jgi:Pyridoxamine 5'-phosphate oxidase
MRRNLRPDQLGDLLTRPLNAIIAVRRADGSVLQTPVWHEWGNDRFRFYIPAGDRKIGMLRANPMISLIVAEPEHPFRAFQVEGTASLTSADFRRTARNIARRYVDAHDPGAQVDDYVGARDGVIVEIEIVASRAWDYADEAYT